MLYAIKRATARDLMWVWLCLSIGNYIYQAMSGRNDWNAAGERSFFQGGAFVALWISQTRLVRGRFVEEEENG